MHTVPGFAQCQVSQIATTRTCYYPVLVSKVTQPRTKYENYSEGCRRKQQRNVLSYCHNICRMSKELAKDNSKMRAFLLHSWCKLNITTRRNQMPTFITHSKYVFRLIHHLDFEKQRMLVNVATLVSDKLMCISTNMWHKQPSFAEVNSQRLILMAVTKMSPLGITRTCHIRIKLKVISRLCHKRLQTESTVVSRVAHLRIFP